MVYKNITGIILAGGQSRRMGNGDKAFALLDGRPLLEYTIENLSAQTDDIIISANRNLDRYSAYGLKVIPDCIGDHEGPLAGIYSAALACKTDYMLVIPCDSPFIPANLAQRMMDSLLKHDANVCIAHDGQRAHPVFMLLHRDIALSIRDYIEAGNRKTLDWVIRQNHILADFSDQPGALMNINTQQDLHILHSPKTI